jgi:hypothetical protein
LLLELNNEELNDEELNDEPISRYSLLTRLWLATDETGNATELLWSKAADWTLWDATDTELDCNAAEAKSEPPAWAVAPFKRPSARPRAPMVKNFIS